MKTRQPTETGVQYYQVMGTYYLRLFKRSLFLYQDRDSNLQFQQ